MKTIFEKSKPGLTCLNISDSKPLSKTIPEKLLRKNLPELPEVSEVDVVRHYIALSKRNFGVDTNFYPLGSCTMKYNPKINEELASLPGFTGLHPLADEKFSQGALKVLYETQKMLSEITGMDEFSLQPAAGAHGEITGIMLVKAYHDKKKNFHKNKILVPDSSHGTNPSSAALCGYEIISIKSNSEGGVDLEELAKAIDNNVAGLMLTNPSTLGLFEKNILKIADMIHAVDGLLYYDGANLNAIMGKCRPGDMGFDVMHVNLHKTFATPHGTGGPGSGPVGVKKHLIPFLPVPRIIKNKKDAFEFSYKEKNSIGKVIGFYGNFLVILKAYVYMKILGKEGLKNVSEMAVLNANYMMNKLKQDYYLPFERTCMHEFVLSSKKQNPFGVHTTDIAKRLIDKGYHPPTIYFPMIVEESIMIEPTETESKETLDEFIKAMIEIASEAQTDKDKLLKAPLSTPVQRLDEATAARNPILKWKKEE